MSGPYIPYDLNFECMRSGCFWNCFVFHRMLPPGGNLLYIFPKTTTGKYGYGGVHLGFEVGYLNSSLSTISPTVILQRSKFVFGIPPRPMFFDYRRQPSHLFIVILFGCRCFRSCGLTFDQPGLDM